MRNRKGMTLIELLIVLAIFSVVMAGLYSAYSVMMRQGVKEYKLAGAELELQIAKTVLDRDLAMTGFGLADIYCEAPVADASCPPGGLFAAKCSDATLNFCVPVPLSGEDQAAGDRLVLMSTAGSRESRAAQEWSYSLVTNPSGSSDFKLWTTATGSTDYREILKADDRVIYIEPNQRKFRVASANNDVTQRTWLFTFPPTDASASLTPESPEKGDLVFGMHTGLNNDLARYADFPYYVITYSLGGTAPSSCAPGTRSLQRGESRKNLSPTGGEVQPVLNCVLDFQVAFALDTNEDGAIDCWDNGGAAAKNYNNDTLKTRVKQIRAYVLVQQGNRDRDYTYSNPADAANPARIRVGDATLTACTGGGVGTYRTLTDEQRKYRWRVIAASAAPRNLR